MPVNFLTEEQRSRYGRFNDDPDEGQLGGFFHLDAVARRRAMACRGAGNQLGWALQLGTARFLGTFLPDPEQTPAVVVDYVAEQLGLHPDDLAGYGTRETRWDHQRQIRSDYGYAEFDGWEWFALARWLYVRCRIGNERPVVLFDRATARLVEAKILLPGVSTLERLVAAVRERAETRLWQNLAGVPDDAEREHLLGLLQVPEGSRVTRLDWLRRAPTTFHAKGLIAAIDRYKELDGYRGEAWEARMRAIPPGRIAELVRYAKAVRAAAVDDLSADRKIATLVAFAASMPAVAADEALDVFDLLMDDLARAAAAGVVRERARTLRDLDAAALLLVEAWRAVTAAAEDPRGDIRAAMKNLEIQAVHAAARTVVELAVAPDDGFAAALAEKYITIIRFLPKLLDSFDFTANPAGRQVLDAAPFVKALRKRRNPISPEALPPGVLTDPWRRRVIGPDGVVDKRAFTVAFTEALRDKLRRHDIYVAGLRRFGDPYARLLTPEAWKTGKTAACEDLGLSAEAGPDLTAWGDSLHTAYTTLSDGLADNPAVRIEDRGGRDRLILTGLDKLDVPESLTWLDAEVAARLPSVDLPEMLLEVHGWVPYLDDFTNVSDSNARARDMHVSVAAVLCAEATNTGLKPVINEGREALRRGRLFWVEQNYVRDECCSRATARMVAFHAAQPIVANWGGGELASADGLRFVTPIRTINSRPNPKYFGPGARRGVTFYNFLFDMYVGFNGIIVPGTQRDSLYILDGLLEQDSGIRPVEITTPTPPALRRSSSGCSGSWATGSPRAWPTPAPPRSTGSTPRPTTANSTT